MPSLFQQARDKAYRDVFLSTDYHGETVLLIKDLGRSEDRAEYDAAIAAAVSAGSYVVVSVSEAVEDPLIGDEGFDRQEEIIVQCCRDEAATNTSGALLGGIAAPDLHTGILRSVERDPEQRAYLFAREAKNESEVLWRLYFRRHLQGTVRATL